MRPPLELEPSSTDDRVVSVVEPVVCSTVLDPTLVCSMVWPLLMTVMMVVVGAISVETSGFVVTTGVPDLAVVLDETDCAVVVAGVSVVGSVVGPADVGEASEDSDGEAEGVGVGVESSEEGAGELVVAGAGAEDEAPVPAACRFTPWWR